MWDENEKLVVFCKNAVETLEYFSRQLAECFAGWGHEVFFLDFADLKKSVEELYGKVKGKSAVLVTFNCIGLSHEPELWDDMLGQSFWENQHIPCLNILVDHPVYYAKVLGWNLPMQVFCVDREHAAYIKRFYPQASCAFLPLAGNSALQGVSNARVLPEDGEVRKPAADTRQQGFEQWQKRPYGIIFTANYVPDAVINRAFWAMEPEYKAFYYGILETLKAQPDRSLLSVMEEHLRRENGSISETELREAMETMPAVDLWIRTYFRANTVKYLIDAGIPLHLFGKDWEQLPVKHPQNRICTGKMVDSKACMAAAGAAKLSLNTMPWFKDGAHDRIYTAMLQGAVSLTDDSIYLRENFTDGDTIVYYDIRQLDRLAGQVQELLSKEAYLYEVACRGNEIARKQHTWQQRAEELRRYI